MQVLDASVIYKWYIEEIDSNKANEILTKYRTGETIITIPDLLIIELANALRFNPKTTLSDIEEIINNIYYLDLNIVVPTLELIKLSTKLSYQYKIIIYDAIYVALAKELGFEFITADEKLYSKIKNFRFVNSLKNL